MMRSVSEILKDLPKDCISNISGYRELIIEYTLRQKDDLRIRTLDRLGGYLVCLNDLGLLSIEECAKLRDYCLG